MRKSFLHLILFLAISLFLSQSKAVADFKYPEAYNKDILPLQALLEKGMLFYKQGNYEASLEYLMAVTDSLDMNMNGWSMSIAPLKYLMGVTDSTNFYSIKNKNEIYFTISKCFGHTGDVLSAIHYLIPVISGTNNIVLLRSAILDGIKYFYIEHSYNLMNVINSGINRMGDVSDDDFDFSAGWFYLLAGYPISAQTFFVKIKDNTDTGLKARYLLAVALLKQGKKKKSQDIFTGLINEKTLARNREPYILSLLSIARILYDAGDFKDAMTFYDQVPSTSEYYTDALYEGSWAAQKANDFAKALELVDKLIADKMPSLDKLKAKVLKGYILVKLKKYDQATDYFNDVIDQYDQAIHILKTNPSLDVLKNSKNWTAANVGSFIRSSSFYNQINNIYNKSAMVYPNMNGLNSFVKESKMQLDQDIFLNDKLLRGYSVGVEDAEDSVLRILLSEYFNSAKDKISILKSFDYAGLSRELMMRYFMTLSSASMEDINLPAYAKAHENTFYVYDPYKNMMNLGRDISKARTNSLNLQMMMVMKDGLLNDKTKPVMHAVQKDESMLAGIKQTMETLIDYKYRDASNEALELNNTYTSLTSVWLKYADGLTLKDVYSNIAGSLEVLASQATIAFIDVRTLSKEAYTERINKAYNESEKDVKNITNKYTNMRKHEAGIVGTLPTTTTINIERGNLNSLKGYLNRLKENMNKLKEMEKHI